MLEVYTSPTANCQRVTVALEVAGLPYRQHRIDRSKGDQRRPEYLQINPAGTVPLLIDPDSLVDGKPLILSQSGAILLHLADKQRSLLPVAGPRRCLAIQWLMQVLTDVNATSSVVYLLSNVANAEDRVVEFFRARLKKFLGDCDRALASSDFLAGDISVADLALYPVVALRREMVESDPELAHLARWLSRLDETSGAKRGLEIA